ncbi:hypothetical protein Q9K02_03135 [Qipengyuania sp. G39]|uniref:Uncharacterized protein n=1 Tax=Qipengyuania profundimaris TaxID=3067652 RepID=A0ABT9HLV5_9SPHN|nr:hypothetical protein [Qipengyuania sp. G39]MDP4574134.1 hypothetical protein [Qipengyuania sp. G39]
MTTFVTCDKKAAINTLATFESLLPLQRFPYKSAFPLWWRRNMVAQACDKSMHLYGYDCP